MTPSITVNPMSDKTDPAGLRKSTPRACWCGVAADVLEDFSTDYRRCPACETLVSLRGETGDLTRVTDERTDLYGEAYWFGHQAVDLGQPTILQRARTDLYERVLHWLKTLLKYRVPPADLLELGCAHGGFVFLARAAGFEAKGLELSPAIAEFAERTFDVPVLRGPIEQQDIRPATLDVIAAMDVLEHLAYPPTTLRRCAELLRPGGLLMLQTPRYPAPLSLDQLRERGDRFPDHLRVAREHLYLFSERGVKTLLKNAGFSHILFEKAIFDHYDMFILASREPIRPLEPGTVDFLEQSPMQRLLLALLDADRCYHRLRAKYDELVKSVRENVQRCDERSG